MRHYIFRSTTEKLPEHLEHIAESGDTVIGDPTFVGGRDWVLLCRKGEARIVDMTPAELEDLIVRALARGSRSVCADTASGIQAGRRVGA